MALAVRPMRDADLAEANRIFRLAFGTFIGLPDPMQFAGDADYVRSRFAAFPDRAYVADRDGELVGSNFASRWGSFGFFGPLTTRPDVWDQGVGKRLLEPVMDRFSSWELRFAGLFTFAESAKHVGLYQKFGFWPRMLTAIMVRPLQHAEAPRGTARFSALAEDEQAQAIRDAAALTDRVYPGLDLSDEIRTVHRLGRGDTVLVRDDAGVAAFAVCHWGPRSEGGTGTCYIKFAAARSGPGAETRLESLLAACDATASGESLSATMAGVNAARDRAWRSLRSGGFKTVIQGVAMHRGNDEGFSRPDAFVLDDWR